MIGSFEGKPSVPPGRKSSPLPADARLFVNREQSALEYYRRVLDEAQDETNPLLERVKFLAIVGSLLAEFFMVRVASLKQQKRSEEVEMSPDGLTPAEQLALIRPVALRLMRDSRECLRSLLHQLDRAGIHVLDYAALNEEQREWVDAYFANIVFPVLTPLAYDPGRPFPHISNLSMNLAVLVRDADGRQHFARVKVPKSLPRLLRIEPSMALPPQESIGPRELAFVWLEQVIAANLQALFPGMQVLEAHPFRVTRDAEVEVLPEEDEDLLEITQRNIRLRQFGSVVRVTINESMPESIRTVLMDNLDVEDGDLYTVEPPLGMTDLMGLHGVDRPDLKYTPFTPRTAPVLQVQGRDLFAAIRQQDILFHHPYDSFTPVVEFVRAAAWDPDVLAIKQTLYRLGRHPPIVEALRQAAQNGKQVAVLVELKARFDEENNIEWAKTLEREGVHVVYGVPGLKTHAKIALIVRKEGEHIRRYTHLATGNYNAVTAQLYTDMGLFTCDEDIGADASDLFNYLTGYSHQTEYRHLLVSPVSLRTGLESMIRREMDHARRGERGHLIFKVNALIDQRMIRLMYQASQAGVQVDLLVRGMCCLLPGLEGISSRIRVISIVGRFLEHSRVYYFRNGGQEEVYLGSADLMPRNLNHRFEILFPLRDPRLVRYERDDLLPIYLSDNVKARQMLSDGTYRRVRPAPGQPLVDSQNWFIGRDTASHTSSLEAPAPSDRRIAPEPQEKETSYASLLAAPRSRGETHTVEGG